MRFIDLFCGCGGFSEGLRQAGHECILAVDNWEIALKSHEANHPGAEHWNRDILTIKPQELPKADFIVGSPPCPQYSILGKNRGKGADTEFLNQFLWLTKDYKTWIGENTPLIKNYLNGVPYKMLRAYNFGLWHKRERCFFGTVPKVKLRTRNPPRFPTPLAKKGGSNRQIQQTISKRKSMDTGISYPPGVAKWIMGFDENYIVHGTIAQQKEQIGNAVCPPVAKAIGEALLPNVESKCSVEI